MSNPVIYLGCMPRADGSLAMSVHVKDGPPPPTPEEILKAAKPDAVFTPTDGKSAQSLGPFSLPKYLIEALAYAESAKPIIDALAALQGVNAPEVSDLVEKAKEITPEVAEPDVGMKP